MNIERATILKNLPKKGFKKNTGKHHIYFHHYYRGKETGPYTFVSHSAKDKTVGSPLIKKCVSNFVWMAIDKL